MAPLSSALDIISRAEAIALGLKRYFTGKPCKNGHVAERYVLSKNCLECNLLWRRENKSLIKERFAKYYSLTVDKRRQSSRDWRVNNSDRHKEYFKLYYRSNCEKRRVESTEWKKANPDRVRESNEARRARKNSKPGFVRRGFRAILRKLQGNSCANCRINLRKAGEHLDHILPIALGGAHEERNLQLLCPNCNGRKHTKHPDVWAAENGRLL